MFKNSHPFQKEKEISPEQEQRNNEELAKQQSFQKSIKRARLNGVPFIVFFIIVGTLILFALPVGKNLLHNKLFVQMIKIILSLVIAVLPFASHRNELKHPLVEKIICPLFFVLTLIFSLIPFTKVYYFINFLFCILVLIGTLVISYFDSELYVFSLLCPIMGFIINFFGIQTLTYVDKSTKVLWMFPLFSALFLLLCALGFCIYKLRPFKNNRNKIIATLVAVPLLSFAIFYLGFTSMNYGLDPSTPQAILFEVVNKRIERDTTSDDSTSYYIDFHSEEKDFSMSVSNILYEEYEIGDIVEFKKYDGFFKVPYYIIEK